MLQAVTVYGKGAQAVRMGSALVYRKWVDAPRGLEAGDLVVVESSRGELLGCAFYDTVGPVALRMIWFWSCPFRSPREALEAIINLAYEYRERLGYTGEGRGYRLIHSDGDLLPGLIIDVYDDVAVVQSSSIVWDKHMPLIVDILVKHASVRHVYEKSVQRTRRDIGLEPRERILYGSKTQVIIEESGVKFLVDVKHGQKTGFFLDQRLNRVELERFVGRDTNSVLDLFSYTGGFGIHALVAGANRAIFVDEDEDALRVLRENLRLNNIPEDRVEIVHDNVWTFLRRDRRKYSIVVADPPAFIQEKEHFERGVKAYLRLYSEVLKRSEDIVFVSSCSAFLTREQFEHVVAESTAIAEKVVRPIGGTRGMPPDHPPRPASPHLSYLKAVFLEVL